MNLKSSVQPLRCMLCGDFLPDKRFKVKASTVAPVFGKYQCEPSSTHPEV